MDETTLNIKNIDLDVILEQVGTEDRGSVDTDAGGVINPLVLAQDAVEEVSIITGGFQAEFGNAQSGMINIVTKEGGAENFNEIRMEDKTGDEELRRELHDWCVDESWFDVARDDCRFMHCLPVRRGVVVRDEILDGPRSVVIQEARNRMLAQMAVLHQMMRDKQ